MKALSIAYSALPASIGSRPSRCLPPAVRLASAALLLALAAAWPVPGRAQYMYLDSNGDGVNTAADQLGPSGPTTFDIWLDTDSNRDGSPVVCAQDASLPMSIFDYGVVLRAVDGTVEWGSFTNRFPTGMNFGEQRSSTEYFNGYGGGQYQTPGLYRLASMTVTVLTGSPSLAIVPSGPSLPTPRAALTLFGTQCYGRDFDGSSVLGRDWFDVDGLAPGPPTVGHPPVLAQPAAMSVPVGALLTQALAATDADGQPVTFSRIAGPAYLWVETADPGRGSATGEVVVAPKYSDVGTMSATVQATDGVSTDQKTFDITVTPVPNRPPILAPMGRIVVMAGTTARRAIVATDADGQPVQFSRVSGPDWALVTTLNPGKGGATGSVRLTPSPHDVGSTSLVVSASDGLAAAERTLEVEVVAPQPAPPNAVLHWPQNADGEDDAAFADLNNDGKLDLVGSGPPYSMSTSLGRGDGTFDTASQYSLGEEVTAVSVADLNGDGRLDVAVATWMTNRLVIFLGNGDGTLSQAAEYAVGARPEKVALRDLNGDGALDAVVGHGSEGFITVYLGRGDGSFGARRDIATAAGPIDLALADFDSDGRVDIATGNLSGRSVTVLFGRGDGTCGRRVDLPAGGSTTFVVAADFNWDGIPDLAANGDAAGIRLWLGAGDGTFAAVPASPAAPVLSRAAAADWNADGNPDLLFTDVDRDQLTVLYGAGDGMFPRGDVLGPGFWSLAVADLNGDGFPDAAVGGRAIVLNQSSSLKAVAARAFLENPNRAVSVTPSGPDFCIRLEPVGEAYSNSQIDMASVTLSSAGTGSVTFIRAVPDGAVTEGDVDGNGIADIPICFAGADLQQLFSGVKGRQTLPVQLTGGLVTGQHFSAPLTLTVVGTGKPLAVRVTPNPMNPSGTVTVTTSRDGFLRVRLYDVRGRLVRAIADVPSAPAGVYEYRVSTGDIGLGSGIYFLSVETSEGILRTRLAVLK